VLIESTPSGARVFVNGKSSGWTPVRISPPRDPSELTLELELAGYDTVRTRLSGQEITPEVNFELTPSQLEQAKTLDAAVQPQGRPLSWAFWTGLTTAAAAAGATGLGIYYGFESRKLGEDMANQKALFQALPEAQKYQQNAVHRQRESKNSALFDDQQQRANILFVAAGTLAVGSIFCFYKHWTQPKLSAGLGQLTLSGEF
jgi:hypothetical protein